jgi:hypothetical protein
VAQKYTERKKGKGFTILIEEKERVSQHATLAGFAYISVV